MKSEHQLPVKLLAKFFFLLRRFRKAKRPGWVDLWSDERVSGLSMWFRLADVSFISPATTTIIDKNQNRKQLRREELRKSKIPFWHWSEDEKSQKFKKLKWKRFNKNNSYRRTGRVQLEIYDNFSLFLFVRGKEGNEDEGKLEIIGNKGDVASCCPYNLRLMCLLLKSLVVFFFNFLLKVKFLFQLRTINIIDTNHSYHKCFSQRFTAEICYHLK